MKHKVEISSEDNYDTFHLLNLADILTFDEAMGDDERPMITNWHVETIGYLITSWLIVLQDKENKLFDNREKLIELFRAVSDGLEEMGI